MKVLIIINPKSGGMQAADNLERQINQAAKKPDFEFEIYRLSEGNHTKNIQSRLGLFKPDIVAVAGGDGTVNFVASLLLNSGLTLLIIPTGSANGMARELNIPNPETALSLLNGGFTDKIDVLKINGKICVHLADVGLNARIVKRFEKDTRRGLGTYARHLFHELFLIKQYRFYIRYNETEISRKAVSLTFANASKYGTGAVINPSGRIDDGQFELVIVKPFPTIKVLSMALKMFFGNLKNSEYVETISCSHALVRSSKKTTLQIDGEVIGKTREIKIEIIKKALQVLIPSERTIR